MFAEEIRHIDSVIHYIAWIGKTVLHIVSDSMLFII